MNVSSDRTWIMVAHLGGARIFESRAVHGDPTIIETIESPEVTGKAEEYRSDQGGRIFNHFTDHRHTAEPQHTIHEQLVDQQARELCQTLKDRLNQNKFAHLVIVAEPKLLGEIRKQMDNTVIKTVVKTVDKDYSQRPDHELVNDLKGLVEEVSLS